MPVFFKRVIISFIFCAISVIQVLYAQVPDNTNAPLHRNSFVNRILYKKQGTDSLVDFADVLSYLFHPKALSAENQAIPKKHNPAISFIPGILYSLSTGVAASVNANATFHAENQNSNLSNVFANINYTQKKQVITQVVTNLWTNNNEYNINSNWSYLKYPQNDFGLGGYSSSNLVDELDYSYLRLYQSVLKKIGNNFYAGPGFQLDYHWNIRDTTTVNKPLNGAAQYGLPSKTNAAGLVMNLLYDTRKNQTNPVPGSTLINLIYRDNVTWLGSDTHSQSLLIDIRKYLRLSKYHDNILAFWSYTSFTLQGRLPYLDLPATAWDTYNNTGRGYVQSRFRGKKMLYLESEYRFNITENKLLGAVIFSNAESFSETPGGQFKTIAPGYGAGLRVKFNKHSNTNVAIDYAFGKGGSRGLFMNLGEMF
jgi:hypothetical protein